KSQDLASTDAKMTEVEKFPIDHLVALDLVSMGHEKDAIEHMAHVTTEAPPDLTCIRLRAYLTRAPADARRVLEVGRAALVIAEKSAASDAERARAHEQRRELEEIVERAREIHDTDLWKVFRKATLLPDFK